jgi:nicotinamidase-related amidase
MEEAVGADRARRTAVSPDRLDPARTCLLLFDLLEGHVKRDAAARERFHPVLANAAALLAAARRVGAMVAYANADHRPDDRHPGLRDTDNRLRPVTAESDRPAIVRGTPEARVVAELAPQASDYIVTKHRWSAFHGTYLDIALRTRNVDTIVLCGGSTDVGVAATAFAARDFDYNLLIVSDACTSPEQDNHAQFMQRIFPRMARIRTSAEVLQMFGAPLEDC